jgi:hypothetical protein
MKTETKHLNLFERIDDSQEQRLPVTFFKLQKNSSLKVRRAKSTFYRSEFFYTIDFYKPISQIEGLVK